MLELLLTSIAIDSLPFSRPAKLELRRKGPCNHCQFDGISSLGP